MGDDDRAWIKGKPVAIAERDAWLLSAIDATLGPTAAQLVREKFDAAAPTKAARTADDALADLIFRYPRTLSDHSVGKLIAADLRAFESLRHPSHSPNNELLLEIIELGGGKRAANSIRIFASRINR
jgi:hypothetical protein